jgi:hypothetical protein
MAAAIRVVASISIAMLLSFPSISTHYFGQHFGATEIRRSIVRHTFVAGPASDGLEEIAQIDTQPAAPMPVIAIGVAMPVYPLALGSEVPVFRLLQHFKLGPSSSDAPDPLH